MVRRRRQYFKNTGGFSIGIANGIEIGLESLLKEQYPTQGGARGNAGFINNLKAV